MSLFRLSNQIFSLGLNAQEISIYAYLCSLPAAEITITGASVVKVKQATIGQHCGIKSPRTVARAIDRLIAYGLVKILERSKKAAQRKGTYVYAVTQQPLQNGYFYAERRVFGQLVPRQMMIYLFMCKSYSPSLGCCWNSYNDIAAQTGMKRETVIQTVNELAAGHFITRIRRKSRANRNVFVDNLYRIVRYAAGKIRKKAARLHSQYSRTIDLPFSKSQNQIHYSRKVVFCQVRKRFVFRSRGSPEFAPLLLNTQRFYLAEKKKVLLYLKYYHYYARENFLNFDLLLVFAVPPVRFSSTAQGGGADSARLIYARASFFFSARRNHRMRNDEFKRLCCAARSASLPDYFRSIGCTVERIGIEYRVREFGLMLNPEKHLWNCFYLKAGGSSAIDCLMTVLNHDFRQAVFELTRQDTASTFLTDRSSERRRRNSPMSKRTLRMPEPSEDRSRLFAYLCRTRKIPAAVVTELVNAGLLYQSECAAALTVSTGECKMYLNANAVFVHRNASGKAIGAEMHGLNSFRRYKGMAEGTGDSAFMFRPVPAQNRIKCRAYIFESAIDLMSFYALCDRRKLAGAVLVSMAGLKPSVLNALQAQDAEIFSCVDNDDAGRRFERENGLIRPSGVIKKLDRQGFKDWNDYLAALSGASDKPTSERNCV